MEENKKEIEHFIEKGETEEALNLLIDSTTGTIASRDAKVLMSRYQTWKRDSMIMGAQNTGELNRINLAILSFTDQVEIDKTPSIDIQNQIFRHPRWKIIMSFLLSVIFIFFLILAFGEFTVSIFVFGEEGESYPVQNEKIRILIGDTDLGIYKTSLNGRVIVDNIPNKYLFRKLEIRTLDRPFIVLRRNVIRPLVNRRMEFYVKPKAVQIYGKVIQSGVGSIPLSGAVIDFNEGLSRDTTDDLGNFRKEILVDKDEMVNINIYYLGAEVGRYEVMPGENENILIVQKSIRNE